MVYFARNVVTSNGKRYFSCFRLLAAILLIVLVASVSSLSAKDPEWSARGKIHLLVKTDPVDIGRRTNDEMPASYSVNYVELLAANKTTEKLICRDCRFINIIPKPMPPKSLNLLIRP